MEIGKDELKTGTTTVGLIVKDGIVLAADMQATMGNLGYDLESKKLSKITERIALTNAGSVGDSITIVRFLRTRAKLYETDREAQITPKALTTFISNVLNSNRYAPYAVQFIIGGMVGKPQLFEIMPYGASIEREQFATSGSGTQIALAVLDEGYKKDMSQEEGIALAVRAIAASKKRDIYTGGRSISVMVVDEQGVKELPEAEVKKYIPNHK
ncbi:MAG: proteasome subunit beta [Candidatus Diapherotrites archaeon]|nr:proteasome subunit beta [Candidatus Diapherotrites archaeon]